MTAVIIAGGKSQRMQMDKALLTVGGKRLIERVLDVIVPLFPAVLINSGMPQYYKEWGVPIVPDIFPGKGVLGGIYTALVHAKTEYVFCVACDMPSLHRDVIRYMIDASANGADVVVPKTADGFHPLHAIYSKRCEPIISESLFRDQLKISAIFPKVRAIYISEPELRHFDPTLELLRNINTPADLIAAREKYNTL